MRSLLKLNTAFFSVSVRGDPCMSPLEPILVPFVRSSERCDKVQCMLLLNRTRETVRHARRSRTGTGFSERGARTLPTFRELVGCRLS